MSYEGIIEALKHRLTGGDPYVAPQVSSPLGSAVRFQLEGAEVVVAHRGVEGRPITERPLISYAIIAENPRFENYLTPYGNRHDEDVEPSMETVTAPDGTTFQRPALAFQRPFAEPLDFMVEIRAYADSLEDLAKLSRHVRKTFKQRGWLTVPLADGSAEEWDLLWADHKNADERVAVQNGTMGLETEGLRIWTYRLEGYLDNSQDKTLRSKPRHLDLLVEPR